MATYYSSSSSQRDVMPVIYPKDPLRTPHLEAQQVLPGNMMYLNHSSSTASYSDSLPGNYQLQLNCGGFSSMGASDSTPSQQGILSDVIGSHMGGPTYDMWRDGRNEVSFMQPMGGSTNMQSIGKQTDSTGDLVHGSATEDLQMGLATQMGILHSGQNLHGQGLSLSLSTQIPTAIPVSLFQYRNPNLGFSSILSSLSSTSGDGGNGAGSCREDEISRREQSRNAKNLPLGFPGGNHNMIKTEASTNIQSSTGLKNMNSHKLSGLSIVVSNSKYLKVAQQLLDEIVDVRKALRQQESDKHQSLGFGSKVSKDNDVESRNDGPLPPTTRIFPNTEESNTNPAGELLPAGSQDLHNKITELLSMLDEVERRYKQYYHQMKIVSSYFDEIAGSGASKPYTTLALQTISRHFRCLRDAISGQIKSIRSSLGEEDTPGNTNGGRISRLRFVEQKLRQQRALQQLGMMRQHAWRPQRGLPETSVTILRAWLFEHFLHPYPKDSDKIMLARQTGLTRGQVSNWFINARVRLWKPMIEDMYKEEIGDTEMESNSSSDNAPKAAKGSVMVSNDGGEASQQNINSAATLCPPGQFHESKSDLTRDVDMSGHMPGDCFQDEGHGEEDTGYGGIQLMGTQKSSMVNCSLPHDTNFQSDGSGNGRLTNATTVYQMAELEMFGCQAGVSLTLGLQHFNGGGLPISDATNHDFVTIQGVDMYNAAASSVDHNNADSDFMDPDTQRYRFAGTLHDFVA